MVRAFLLIFLLAVKLFYETVVSSLRKDSDYEKENCFDGFDSLIVCRSY